MPRTRTPSSPPLGEVDEELAGAGRGRHRHFQRKGNLRIVVDRLFKFLYRLVVEKQRGSQHRLGAAGSFTGFGIPGHTQSSEGSAGISPLLELRRLAVLFAFQNSPVKAVRELRHGGERGGLGQYGGTKHTQKE